MLQGGYNLSSDPSPASHDTHATHSTQSSPLRPGMGALLDSADLAAVQSSLAQMQLHKASAPWAQGECLLPALRALRLLCMRWAGLVCLVFGLVEGGLMNMQLQPAAEPQKRPGTPAPTHTPPAPPSSEHCSATPVCLPAGARHQRAGRRPQRPSSLARERVRGRCAQVARHGLSGAAPAWQPVLPHLAPQAAAAGRDGGVQRAQQAAAGIFPGPPLLAVRPRWVPAAGACGGAAQPASAAAAGWLPG